jgi:hypothetical protein
MRLGKACLLALCACVLLNGCIFAPTQYGPRGCVGPGSEQFQKYLANCRSKSSLLDRVCRERGEPELIEVGNSGGYFLWRNPTRVLSVHSFGRTSEIGGIPKSMRRYLERQAQLNGETPPPRRVRARAAQTSRAPAPASAPQAPAEPVVQVVSLDYDVDTRHGKIAVKFAAGSFEEARRYVRRNVETLAKDKNVALTTGQIPAAAKFYLGDERVKDGNVLEVEFETE